MAKIWVTDSAGKTRVPFLRGILTRSLTEAGLPFDDAYKMSSDLRQRLGDEINEITRDELCSQVAVYLEEKYGGGARAAYEALGGPDPTVTVRGRDGKRKPFSKVQHMRSLESCGLTQEQASVTSSAIQSYLLDGNVLEVPSCELGRLTHGRLREKFGESMAHRYLVWIDHARSGHPLVLLIGGTTGSGKSSVATDVAHHLGIVRTQSTDMLREVMRMMIPERLLPVLHTSSFNAGFSLPGAVNNAEDYDAQLADGYLTQSELLSVPCEAVVQRALREHVSVILEGVHLHPSLLQRIDGDGVATVVMVTLAVLDPDQLRARLAGRVLDAPARNESAHLGQFDKIWRLQSFLLSEADRAGIPILVNDDKDKITNMIMATIIDVLATKFDKSPEEVFHAAG